MFGRFTCNAAFGVAISCLLSHSLFAQQSVFSIDPTQSSVAFTLPDVLHTVHGSFRVQAASISFNRDSGRIEGRVVVDSASGASGNRLRDDRMAKDELRSQLFPIVIFTPAQLYGSVPISGEADIMIRGTLTLLGQNHPLQMPLKVHVQGAACSASGEFTVPYVRWGLKDPSTFLLKVSQEVKIDVLLRGDLK